jgi:type II secretory pathway pseudopilin PulG
MATVGLLGPLALFFGSIGLGALSGAGVPLPLDPTLSAIAPEDCLWYVASAGLTRPDSGSTNQTEQLLAEPQVQRFLREFEEEVVAVVRRNVGSDARSRVLATEGPKILKILLTRPMAIYVEDLRIADDRTWTIEGALVVNAGDQQAALKASLAAIRRSVTGVALLVAAEQNEGVEWLRLALPSPVPPIRLGWKGEYLIVAVGEATPAAVLKRFAGSTPQWLSELRSEHAVEREMTLQYVNVAAVLDRAKPLMDAQNPSAWAALEKLGLTSIRAIHSRSGYDADGCSTFQHLVTNEGRSGLMAFLPHRRLTLEDLAIVPREPLAALVIQLNLSDVMDRALTLVGQFDPRARETMEAGLWQLDSHVGFSLREEVVDSIGDAWVVYVPSGDVLLSWLNAAAAVEVKDAPALRNAAAQLVELVREELARTGAEASITESEIDDQTLYKIESRGEPMPFAPSLCITDEWLIVGLLPQAVQAAVERESDDSLAAHPAVGPLFDGAAPAALFYRDTPQAVRSAYPFVQIGLQMLSSQLREQGVAIDTTSLPSAETVAKHLRPSVSSWRYASDGFHAESRGSLPGGGNIVGVAPVVAGLVMPAVAQSRARAQEARELNNLRQLSLAIMNYESAHRSLPTDVYGEDGRPLLSWRVRLLPFLEAGGGEFYSEIKLDEPWDSEHNRQFHARMPEVLTSTTPSGRPGMTRVEALKGTETVFAGSEKFDYADLTDGTSNTLLLVQAAPEAAVPWMKPADIEFTATAPFAGVAQPSGAFLAAFCDGSVRRLSLAIGEPTMRAIATRAGGESVEYDALSEPPAPELYPMIAPADVPAP